MKKIISCISILILCFSMFNFSIANANDKQKLDAYCSSKTTTSIKIKWNEFKGYSYCNIYRKKFSSKSKFKFTSKNLICENNTKFSFRDENLKVNTTYRYKIIAYGVDENNKLMRYIDYIQVTTKKPTSYKNPKKYISHMTKNEKLELIEKDFNNIFNIPNSSKIKEFKITKYDSGTKTYHNYYGYNAKIEINKKYYNKLVNKFKPLSDSDGELVYYTNVFKDKIKYCTHFYMTPRSGRLSKNAWIKTVWTSGAIAVIDGKYYLFVNTYFSSANEYFSKHYNKV